MTTIAGPDEKPRPYIYGFICTQERIEAVQRDATPAEAVAIESYRVNYHDSLGRWPHGLHYIPLPNQAETVAVWFGPVD